MALLADNRTALERHLPALGWLASTASTGNVFEWLALARGRVVT